MNDHSAAMTAFVAVKNVAPPAPRPDTAPPVAPPAPRPDTAPPVAPPAPRPDSAPFAPPRPALQIVRTIASAREALAPARLAGITIGFVPTMGALHEGHLSLIEAARRECDLVVISVFVNPTQFNEQADLLRYPRQEAKDAALAKRAGADILFAPEVSEIYPDGFHSAVEVLGITDTLEGEMRGSGHFRGMTTIVCKLLNIVQPTIAYFGQKDAQQAAVVKRMAIDLNIPVTIETMPTVREADGLAMSSRNARLSAAERSQALGLHAALTAAMERSGAGERSSSALIAAANEAIDRFGVKPEYVAIVNEDSFERVEEIEGEALMLIAARVGQTRLIDNARLSCPIALAQEDVPLAQDDVPLAEEDLPLAQEDRGSDAAAHTQREQGDVISVCSA